MKNKKGFTLVEILAVIIILAVIALLVSPMIIGNINDSREKLYDTQIDNIKSAARNLMIDLEINNDETLIFTLEELKRAGYLEEDLQNPKTNKPFNNCLTIVVSKKNDLYNYEIVDSESDGCEITSNVIMVLLGSENEKVSKNDAYIEPGVVIRDDRGNTLDSNNISVKVSQTKDNITTIITENGAYNQLTTLIKTGDEYQYTIDYKYTDKAGNTIIKSRNVSVVTNEGLKCEIVPTTEANDAGWVLTERKAKIIGLNSNGNLEYSISLNNTKNYSSEDTLELSNDGVVTIYGYVKDIVTNQEASCSNTIKYEVGEPSVDINLIGTEGNNGWFKSDVTATLNITPISTIVGQDISTSDVKTYNNRSSLDLTSSGNVYGYVKDEASKEVAVSKEVKIDKVAPNITTLSAGSLKTTNNNTTELTLTVSATDSGSGIDYYEFFMYSDTYKIEKPLGTSKNNYVVITSFQNGYDYKVKVYDVAGNVSEKSLDETCEKTPGTCTSGSITDIYKCNPTGRQYSITTDCSNTTTTTSKSIIDNVINSGGESGSSSNEGSDCTPRSCSSGFYWSGCTCWPSTICQDNRCDEYDEDDNLVDSSSATCDGFTCVSDGD